MCHGNKELTVVFTNFYQALLINMHIQVVYLSEVRHLRVPKGVNFQ